MSNIANLTEFRSFVPDNNFMSSVFNFDVRQLETTTDVYISQSVIALAQYLIYFKYNYNLTRAELTRKQKTLEDSIFMLTTDEITKKYKTKKDSRSWMINNMEPLSVLSKEVEDLQSEVYLLEGIDKNISELIAAFKRELTRRENELYQGRRAG